LLQRGIRIGSIFYRNIGKGGTKATVQALPGDALRVSLDLARPWTFRPGQHLYLYVPSIGLWTSHPFSVAWSEEQEDLSSEKGIAMNRTDILAMRKTRISLIVRRRTGFTDRLFKMAESAPGGNVGLKAFVEGPYGKLMRNLKKLNEHVLI
jgi:predicted ferric reductase